MKMPKNNVDDASSVVSTSTIGSQLSKKSSKAIPRCHCSWKNCRSWQKSFHAAHHNLFDGIVKISWDKGDEQMKSKWDKFLKVEEAKRLGKRYYVARHHFPEELIKEFLKNPASWDWSDKWTKEEAEKVYGFVPLSAASGEDNGLYYKLPLVPKDNVKEIVKKVRKETASTINEEEEMPPTTLSVPSSSTKSSSAHRDKHSPRGRGKHSSNRQSHSSSPSRGGTDRKKKSNGESISSSPPARNSAKKSLEPPRRPGSPVNGPNAIPKSPLLEPKSPISESVQISSSSPLPVQSLSPPPRPGLGAESTSGQSQLSRREVFFDNENAAKQTGNHRAPSDGLTIMKSEGVDETGSLESNSIRERRSSSGRGANGGAVGKPKIAARQASSGMPNMNALSVAEDAGKQEKVRLMEEEERSVSERNFNKGGRYGEGEDDSPFDGSEKGRYGEDDSPFGILNNAQEEEKKDGAMEMIQIPASDYEALLAERDGLRATAEEHEHSINKLNEEISALKKDILAYKEKDNNKLDSVGVAAKTLAIYGVGGNSQDATIEYLKVENERLNQKAAYLFQRNQTYEKTIEEYEEQMASICDAAVDREREVKKLLVNNPWQLIANTIFPSDDGD